MTLLSNLLFIFVVAGTAIRATEGHGEILDGWFHTNMSYKYRVHFTATSWHEARQYCKSIGGDLAVHTMKDYGTRVAISNIMLLKDHFFWIGLSDQALEGHWSWVDGSTGLTSNVHWYRGEPNNYGRGEDCAGINAGRDFRTNDVHCNHRALALCEKEI